MLAQLHLDEVGGFPGPARTYKLSEPITLGSVTTEYVTVWYQRGYTHQEPEIGVVAATETGACIESSVRRRPGSAVLYFTPETPEQIEGAYVYALMPLGVTEIE